MTEPHLERFRSKVTQLLALTLAQMVKPLSLRMMIPFTASDFQFTLDGKAIAVANGDKVKYLSLDLDTLLAEGCNKLRSYLKTNPNVNQGDRHLCDGISS